MNLTNFSLGIGAPCSFPMVPMSFFYSFIHLERPDYVFIHADNGPVDTLRNDIVEKALDIGITTLMMCDTDMVYHPKTITSLLSRRLPIVGALCFRRYPPFDSIMMKLTENGYESIDEWEEGDLVEVDATGAGCIMYDMEVFRNMPRPWFRFQKDPATGMTIGEDIGFCQDLKAAGYRIFVDTAVPCEHLATIAVNHSWNKLWRSMETEKQRRAMASVIPDKEDRAA